MAAMSATFKEAKDQGGDRWSLRKSIYMVAESQPQLDGL